jgi:hypothetical protein
MHSARFNLSTADATTPEPINMTPVMAVTESSFSITFSPLYVKYRRLISAVANRKST